MIHIDDKWWWGLIHAQLVSVCYFGWHNGSRPPHEVLSRMTSNVMLLPNQNRGLFLLLGGGISKLHIQWDPQGMVGLRNGITNSDSRKKRVNLSNVNFIRRSGNLKQYRIIPKMLSPRVFDGYMKQWNPSFLNKPSRGNHEATYLTDHAVAASFAPCESLGKSRHSARWKSDLFEYSRCWVAVLEFKHPNWQLASLQSEVAKICKNTSLQQNILMSLHALRLRNYRFPYSKVADFLTPQQPQQLGNDPLLS